MFLTNPPKELDFTEDGYDIQWGTNVLGVSQILLENKLI